MELDFFIYLFFLHILIEDPWFMVTFSVIAVLDCMQSARFCFIHKQETAYSHSWETIAVRSFLK